MKIGEEQKKRKKIMEHAYATTTFYMKSAEENKILPEDVEVWEHLPVIRKADLVMNENSFLSAIYLPLLLQKKLLRIHTSGSTGTCATVYWKDSESKLSLLPLWLKRKYYYQIDPHDRHFYFFTGRRIGTQDIEMENIGYALGFCKSNLDDKKIIEIWNKMLKFSPIWLVLQPSVASLLCKVVETYNLQRLPELRYIEMTGEMLFKSTRDRIESVLHAKVVNQYGCNEMNSIAYECPEGNLHCMEGNVYVEILNERGEPVQGGEEGEICITSLTNYAMPLIRYLIGDSGKMVSCECKCGSKEKIIELTNGRSNDRVIDNNGELLNTYIFVRCIENINTIYEDAILQYQIIQHQIGEFTIKLVIDDEWGEMEIQSLFIENLWQSSLEGAEFKFEFYQYLFPDSEYGKLKWFINEMEQKNEKRTTD